MCLKSEKLLEDNLIKSNKIDDNCDDEDNKLWKSSDYDDSDCEQEDFPEEVLITKSL